MNIELKKSHTRKEWISFIIHLMQVVLVAIIAIGLVSAVYAGETFTHDFGYEIINCSIEGNSYNLDGLELNWEGSIATISTIINYQPDSFTLSCWINQSYEVVEVHSSGGHHHHSNPTTILNTTNQTQQGNSSLNTNFSYPAGNNQSIEWIPEIEGIKIDEWATWDYNSTELNNETIGFFESLTNSLGNFFERIWNWLFGWT